MKRSGFRRFDWFRAWHGLPSHPIWRAVSRASGVPTATCLAVALAIMDSASKARPRGSVVGLKPYTIAGYLDLPDETVDAVIAAMRDPKVGWIKADAIASWHDHQPEREDPQATERTQEFRERMKHRATRETAPKRPDAHKTRPDQTRDRPEREIEGPIKGPSISLVQKKEAAGKETQMPPLNVTHKRELTEAEELDAWFANVGINKIVDLTGMGRLRAGSTMQHWRKEAGDILVKGVLLACPADGGRQWIENQIILEKEMATQVNAGKPTGTQENADVR